MGSCLLDESVVLIAAEIKDRAGVVGLAGGVGGHRHPDSAQGLRHEAVAVALLGRSPAVTVPSAPAAGLWAASLAKSTVGLSVTALLRVRTATSPSRGSALQCGLRLTLLTGLLLAREERFRPSYFTVRFGRRRGRNRRQCVVTHVQQQDGCHAGADWPWQCHASQRRAFRRGWRRRRRRCRRGTPPPGGTGWYSSSPRVPHAAEKRRPCQG